jgi:hypothetical protein
MPIDEALSELELLELPKIEEIEKHIDDSNDKEKEDYCKTTGVYLVENDIVKSIGISYHLDKPIEYMGSYRAKGRFKTIEHILAPAIREGADVITVQYFIEGELNRELFPNILHPYSNELKETSEGHGIKYYKFKDK